MNNEKDVVQTVEEVKLGWKRRMQIICKHVG